MKHNKKVYTKYDYIRIYSKLGMITSTFAAISMSLALFLGFVVTLTGHAHLDLSSVICLVLFVLNLPVMFRNIKRYKTVPNKLQKNGPDNIEENAADQTILLTGKQLCGFILMLGFLALVILSLCILMLWLTVSCYETIFLILFILLGSLSLPVLAVMVIYIRLLLIIKDLK